jgi:hypothetical protein
VCQFDTLLDAVRQGRPVPHKQLAREDMKQRYAIILSCYLPLWQQAVRDKDTKSFLPL